MAEGSAKQRRVSIPDKLLKDGSPSKALGDGQFKNADLGIRGYVWKVLCVGQMGVGKTSYLRRTVHGVFKGDYKSTIGVDFLQKDWSFRSNEIRIQMQLWDIAGQERFGTMTRVYFKEAKGALVVCDNRTVNFTAVDYWKQDIDDKVELPDGRPIPCLLLVAKGDVEPESDFPSDERLDAYVREAGFVAWTRISSKTGDGCEEALEQFAKHMLEIDVDHPMPEADGSSSGGSSSPSSTSGVVRLTNKPIAAERRRNCKC